MGEGWGEGGGEPMTSPIANTLFNVNRAQSTKCDALYPARRANAPLSRRNKHSGVLRDARVATRLIAPGTQTTSPRM